MMSVAVDDGPVLEVTKPFNDQKNCLAGHYTAAKCMWDAVYSAYFTIHKEMHLLTFFAATSVHS